MFEIIFVLAAISGAIIATYTDLKDRIVPNRLTFPLMALGIFGHLVWAAAEGEIGIVITALKSLLLIFAVGFALNIIGIMPAGDVKEFMFIGALIPVYPTFLKGVLDPALPAYPFIITVFLNSFLVAFPLIGIIALMVAMVRSGATSFLSPLADYKRITNLSYYIVSCWAISNLVPLPMIVILLIASLVRIREDLKVLLLLLGIGAFVVASPMANAIQVAKYFVTSLLFISFISVLLNSFGILKKEALSTTVKITDLEEGDILGEEIYSREGKVFRDERSFIEKLKVAMRKGNLEVLSRSGLVANTTSTGVNPREIMDLKKHVGDGVLEDSVLIKRSIPFAPIILASLLVSLTVGDIGSLLRSIL